MIKKYFFTISDLFFVFLDLSRDASKTTENHYG